MKAWRADDHHGAVVPRLMSEVDQPSNMVFGGDARRSLMSPRGARLPATRHHSEAIAPGDWGHEAAMSVARERHPWMRLIRTLRA